MKLASRDPFFQDILSLIRAIPAGKVATYGQISCLAGDPWGTRQVVRALHACSDKGNLPWQRVINSRGGISLRPGRGAEEQRRRLRAEGVKFDRRGRLNLDKFQWDPTLGQLSKVLRKCLLQQSRR
jgi:methylated-DNA-protein-cysteine methyltransferase-like protein